MKSYKIIFLLCAAILFASSCGMFGGKSSVKKKEHDGLILVDDSLKDYYVDRTGKKVFECPAADCTEFSEGVASQRIYGDQASKFFDKTGKVLFEGTFVSAEPFAEGLAIVKVKDPADATNHKYGAIDKTGKMVVDAKFDDLRSFSDGLAAFAMKPAQPTGGALGICPSDCKYGYVDKTGKIVIEAQFDIAEPFSDGYAIVEKEAYKDTGRFIDKTGKEPEWSAKYKYDDAKPFSEGFGAIKTYSDGWIFIDAKGEKAFEPKDGVKFDEVRPFSEGWAAVKLNRSGSSRDSEILRPWTFINTSGKLREGVSFEEVKDFSEGMAAVKDGRMWIYVKPDETDSDALTKKTRYEKAEPFRGGLALVETEIGSKAKKAFVDADGKTIWQESD